MTAQELLIHLTQKRVDALFEAARNIPADKLNWKPTENSRSALDQVQEVATALARFNPASGQRKIDFDPKMFAEWVEERQKITDLDELEKICRDQTAGLLEGIKNTKNEEFEDKYELPFPGEFRLADILSYHLWNCGYHEGQINYIGTLLQ